jgi:nucleotide-binding universal stress UspA family protein
MERVEAIVVGVDGSADAQAALRFAIEEARLRHARVRAVSVWTVSAVSYTALGYPFWPKLLRDLGEAAETLLQRQVQEARDKAGEADVECVVRQGSPAEVLIEEAGDAFLLVVGSRGLGGFASLLLGSVSHAAVAHAPCPVTIVRQRKKRA